MLFFLKKTTTLKFICCIKEMQQMGIVKFQMWVWMFDIPRKDIEDFCVIISVAVGILSKRLTDTFWLVCVMLRSYIFMLFQYLWISPQIEPDVTLCYHCMLTLEIVHTKSSMCSHSVRFSSGVLNVTKKVLKLTKLVTQISKFRLIYEESNKISILISSLLRG